MRKIEKTDPPAPPLRPQAVLFACGMNTVRSPMAAALVRQGLGDSLYVGAAGVRTGELDPFAIAAMEEIGIDIHAHRPMTFEELDDLEGLNFDLIVTLAPEAHHKALQHARAPPPLAPPRVQLWPAPPPARDQGPPRAAPGPLRGVPRSVAAANRG